MKRTVNLTAEGKADLEKELADLIAQRPAIAERLATARAFGDLSENQEYSDARAEQKTVENRIAEIEETLKNAVIIKAKKSDKVIVGSEVTIVKIRLIRLLVRLKLIRLKVRFRTNHRSVRNCLVVKQVKNLILMAKKSRLKRSSL